MFEVKNVKYKKFKYHMKHRMTRTKLI